MVASFGAILIVIMSVIIVSFSSNYILTRKEDSMVAVINVSGRQRMLSQRIALLSQMIAIDISPTSRRVLTDKLQSAVDLMEKSHFSLKAGTVVPQSISEMSESVHGLFFVGDNAIDVIVPDYIRHARRIVSDWENIDLNSPDLIHILRDGPTIIVTSLDNLVAQYQREGEKNIATIIRIEKLSLAFGLLFLVLLALFVFRSLVSRVDKQSKELKQSKNSLINAEYLAEQLRGALNEHSLVSITDVKGKIVYANSKFSEVSGYSMAELINVNHSIIKSDMHDDAFFKDLWQTISSGQIWRGEICNKTKDGNTYWVNSTIVPFLNKDTSRPEYYVSIRNEITEQKEMHAKMDKLFWEATAANEAKSSFLTNMSHELRTPLNHIIGFSQVVEMNTDDPDILKNISYIRQAGDDLLQKVNNILEMVSHDNMVNKDVELFDIVKLVDADFVEYFQSIAEKSNRKFTRNIPEQEIFVMANRLDLLTAFRKVAKNAVQFSSENDIVGVSVSLDEDIVTVAIFDTGPGLPDEILSSYLIPFTIGEKVTTKMNSGMGLGLPIARKLCMQNGGELKLDSKPAIGTKVIFTFPVAQPEAMVEGKGVPPRPVNGANDSLNI
ncbi:diguanylate cyclase/phosphodiesterase (GGDEF & EAL domains) with PAS/PAC sensor(s) [hydrothermal vent metagenome]|uniref:histidine kinase n=1 Tax=hydrothermal vent metagenome TaxID=652676 RepID=A0A3B0S9Z8_9ZZZZ